MEQSKISEPTRSASAGLLVSGLWTWQILAALYTQLKGVIHALFRFWTALQMYRSVQYVIAEEQPNDGDIQETKNSNPFFIFSRPFYKETRVNTSFVKGTQTHQTYLSILGKCAPKSLFRPLFKHLEAKNNCKSIQTTDERGFHTCSGDFSSSAFLDSSAADVDKQSQCDWLVTQNPVKLQELPEKAVWSEKGGEATEKERIENTCDNESDDLSDNSESECDENEKLWKSFFKCTDPYRLFNFQACVSSVPTNKNKVKHFSPHVNNGKLSQEEEALGAKTERELQSPPNDCTCYDDNVFNVQKVEKVSLLPMGDEAKMGTRTEEKEECRDSFFKCNSSYSPFNLKAPVGSATEKNIPLEHSSKCPGNTGESGEDSGKVFASISSHNEVDSQSLSDDDNFGDDEESDMEDSDKLWESFLKTEDPYNPLNFTACISSSPSMNEGDIKLKKESQSAEQLCSVELKHVKTRKPVLPERHFKHFCGPASGNATKVCVWKKPTKSVTMDMPKGQCQNNTLKQVRFSPVVQVHTMFAWPFASRAARKGPWEEMARDRARFRHRINESEKVLGNCLDSSYRKKAWAKMCVSKVAC